MEILATILVVINVLIFFYFVFVNFSYITLIIFSYIQTKRSKKESSIFQLSGLFDTRLYKSISILAPAYNEEASIIESTEALLHLEFADYEILWSMMVRRIKRSRS